MSEHHLAAAASDRRFAGRVAIVTGASRGIGEAVALKLSAEGAAVVLGAHPSDADRLNACADRCQQGGGQALAIPADLADPSTAEELVATAVRQFDRLDCLVNNAFAEEEGSVEQVSLAGWERTLRVSLTAAMLTARYGIPVMLQNGGGAIVNVTSQRAFAAGHGAAAYESAKAGLVALTRSIAVDFGSDGIRCNCVSPGLIETDRVKNWLESGAARRRALDAAVPLGRPGRPTEVAHAIAFLLSNEAAYITGTVLAVDGGALAGLPENAALALSGELDAASNSHDGARAGLE